MGADQSQPRPSGASALDPLPYSSSGDIRMAMTISGECLHTLSWVKPSNDDLNTLAQIVEGDEQMDASSRASGTSTPPRPARAPAEDGAADSDSSDTARWDDRGGNTGTAPSDGSARSSAARRAAASPRGRRPGGGADAEADDSDSDSGGRASPADAGPSAESQDEGGDDGDDRPAQPRRTCGFSSSGNESSEPWGWFEEHNDNEFDSLSRHTSCTTLAADIPETVLEGPLAAQALYWHLASGRAEAPRNMERAMADDYHARAAAQDSGGDPLAARPERPFFERQVVYRGASPFGMSFTRAFTCPHCSTVSSIMVHIPKFQIVRTHGVFSHAEFLVVMGIGQITFGVWRRYTDFKTLAEQIVRDAKDGGNLDGSDLTNTVYAWRTLTRRKRWWRCLDTEYLSVKCFLLERFLHDLVLELGSLQRIQAFLGIGEGGGGGEAAGEEPAAPDADEPAADADDAGVRHDAFIRSLVGAGLGSPQGTKSVSSGGSGGGGMRRSKSRRGVRSQ